MIPRHNFREKRILFIMEDFRCDRDAAERIHDDIMERTDEFGDLARQYIIMGGNRKGGGKMKTYEVTQTYWDITEDENSDNYYTATVVVEANSPKEAERKACLEGLFDDEYEIPIENIGISDVYDVVEIEE